MPTIFTRIIDGEIPGAFVWRDDLCVAFMSINPMAYGHALVVPIDEVDHWVDADAALADHLFAVTRHIAQAQAEAFRPEATVASVCRAALDAALSASLASDQTAPPGLYAGELPAA